MANLYIRIVYCVLCFQNQLSLYTLVYCYLMKMGHIYSIYFEEGLKTLNFTWRKFEQVLQLCTRNATSLNTIEKIHFYSNIYIYIYIYIYIVQNEKIKNKNFLKI